MSKRKSTMPQVETRRMMLSDLLPADYNPRRISDRAMKGLRASLERFGELGGIVYNEQTGRLVGGHQRVKALAAMGVVDAEVRVVNMPLAEEKAANVTLNNPGIGGDWDDDLLRVVLDDVKRDLPTAFDELQLGDLVASLVADEPEGAGAEGEEKYTRKIELPTYEPKGEKPHLSALADQTKTKELTRRIEAADVPDDVRAFLRLAAERHTVFNFREIAEYYCHCEPEVQRLFEESSLVIVDFKQAIANGVVKFNETIFDLVDIERSGDDA